MWTEKMDEILTSPSARRIVPQLSPIYGNAYTALWLFNTIGLQLDEMEQWSDELMLQVIPQTVTWAIGYFEQDYGLDSNDDLTLDERRARLLAKIRTREPMNPRHVEQLLSMLTGITVTITENISKNRFRVSVDGEMSDEVKTAFKNLLNSVKPAHLIYLLSIILRMTATGYITFDPIKLVIRTVANAWKMDHVLLNGEKILDGTWTLDHQVRGHFELQQFHLHIHANGKPKLAQVWMLPPSSASLTLQTAGTLRRRHPWHLNGEFTLNGEQLLQPALYEEVF